jgi:hypothetical protein
MILSTHWLRCSVRAVSPTPARAVQHAWLHMEHPTQGALGLLHVGVPHMPLNIPSNIEELVGLAAATAANPATAAIGAR